MAQRIAMFNHKGGVGKTVDTFHLGWKLTEYDYKVLLVDGDSQVNLTALALGPDRFYDYYEDENTRLCNVKDGVSPVFEGKPTTIEAFDCPTATKNSSLFILPGHADLAKYEGQLSLAQETAGTLSVLKNLPGSLSALISRIEDRHGIDFTIIDLNPGLGAINQNFFLACDAFVVPTNPDPFSLMGISTLGEHLTRWVNWKRANSDKFADSDYPLTDSTPKFLGTINARFNKHASKAARKFDERIKAIDAKVTDTLVPILRKAGMLFKDDCYEDVYEIWKAELKGEEDGIYALARLPDFQSLVHSATNSELPVFAVTERDLKDDGLGGNVLTQALTNASDFDRIFDAIADKIVNLLDAKCS